MTILTDTSSAGQALPTEIDLIGDSLSVSCMKSSGLMVYGTSRGAKEPQLIHRCWTRGGVVSCLEVATRDDWSNLHVIERFEA
jgi:hypothetical protein